MGIYALTGGASGIGAALTSKLKNAGHEIINIDIRDAEVLADLTKSDGRSEAITRVQALAPEGLDGFIPVAGLGAGSGHPGRLITGLNYFGAVRLIEGLRGLLERTSCHALLHF